jgi:hypothetical protein
VVTLFAYERVQHRERADAREVAEFNRELAALRRLGGHGGNGG